MRYRWFIFTVLVTGLILVACGSTATPTPTTVPPTEAPSPTEAPEPTPDLTAGLDYGPEFHIQGSQVRLIGGYGDNMDYSGENVQVGEGSAELHLDADGNTGSIVVTFTVDRFNPSKDIDLENATVTLIYPLFGFPPGVDMPEYMEGGIADNMILHGDSGQEAPIMPNVRNAVASWGPVLVFVNGEQLMGAETMMGMPNPMGAFLGHMMYSDVVRDPETQAVFNADGSGSYSPMDPSNGSVVVEDISLLHLIVRSEVEDPDNFPGFDFFIHVNFEDTGEATAMPISEMNFAMMMEMPMDQLMEMIMSMMPQP